MQHFTRNYQLKGLDKKRTEERKTILGREKEDEKDQWDSVEAFEAAS